MQSEPFVFTVLSSEHPGFFRLLRSARRRGWKLQPFFFPMSQVGMEEDQVIFSKAYMKFMDTKHLKQTDILRDAWLKGFKKFLFVDAWDVIFTGEPKDINFRPGLSFSGEAGFTPSKGAYPIPEYSEFFPGPGPFKELNAGVCWGDIATWLERCPQYEGFDQLLWHREYVRDPEGIFIDSNAENAVSIWGNTDLTEWSRIEGRWRLNLTNTFPSVVHGNGKWLIQPALDV